MPLYVYRCEKCGKESELLRPIAYRDDPARCSDNELPASPGAPGPCRGRMVRVLTAIGGYEIKGDNSASVTPRKFRKEKS